MTEYKLVRKEELKDYIGYKGRLLTVHVVRSGEGVISFVSERKIILDLLSVRRQIPTDIVVMAEMKL